MKKQLLLIVMFLLPLAASADAVEINGIYYNLISDGNVAEVTSNPNKYSGNVEIPESVTYGDVKYSVTKIGREAFYECSGLTSVTIPSSVTYMDEYAFYYCDKLTSVKISDLVAWCNIKFESWNSNPLRLAHKLYVNGSLLSQLVIPSSVTVIGDETFQGASCLTSLTIHDKVTSIGTGAFNSCTGLSKVTIPNSVTTINWGAFYNCQGLKSVDIGNSVTTIGTNAFTFCEGIKTINIPNSVTTIGDGAFDCCRGLTKVTIPNSVTTIGEYSFAYCSSLTSISIPSSVKSIGIGAFDGTYLASVISCITEPFSIIGNDSDTRTFDWRTFQNATLYVPQGTINKYKAISGWKDFAHIEESAPSGIKTVKNNLNHMTTIYDLNGVAQPEPKKGVNIVNGKKIIVK